MKIIIHWISVLSLFVNGADILLSTGIELTNVFPFKAKNNYYSVLAGNNNIIQRKQYSQLKSPGIDNYFLNIPLIDTLDSPFTELQSLIVNERIYKTYFNPIEDVGLNNKVSSSSVIINNLTGLGSSSILSITNGGISTSTMAIYNGNSISGSTIEGTQTIVVDNNASGRLNGNTLTNTKSMREKGSINIPTSPSSSSNTPVKPTNTPTISPTISTKSSSRIMTLSITIIIIVLIF